MKIKKWILSLRQYCDLEMLLVGGFEPLSGFISQPDYESVLLNMRLANGQIWPIPITLDINEEFAAKILTGEKIALCQSDNTVLAYLHISNKWKPDKLAEARLVFGTEDIAHPGVNYLFNTAGDWYLGGFIQPVQLPNHYDFTELRYTPKSLKNHFLQLGFNKIIGFQTRNPMHRAHMELTMRAAREYTAHLLIHPVVGMTKPGDIDYYTRVRCYEKILGYFPPKTATLSLLPLAMRMGGPREALWHAIIRKNYGCTHFIVGRDHAGPGNDSNGKPFYDPYEAQHLVNQYQDKLSIKLVPFEEMVYVKERKQYCLVSELKPQETACSISGTELRHALSSNKDIPDWFSVPEVIHELRQSYPPRHKQGFTLFFTGLSGAGKTTLAQALMSRLMSQGIKNVTILDGDVMRQVLATELGFGKTDRDTNIRRMGFVACEITKVGGIALCAAIAPYKAARDYNRQLIIKHGGYIEVYVATSLSVCKKRDTKGLYAKAQAGELKGITGVDDPYEPPINPDIVIDTSLLSIEECVSHIIQFLQREGYLIFSLEQSCRSRLPDALSISIPTVMI